MQQSLQSLPELKPSPDKFSYIYPSLAKINQILKKVIKFVAQFCEVLPSLAELNHVC